MKKTLAIVLCILAVCFASCNKEKPNQKFIGAYNGNMTTDIIGTAMNQSIPLPVDTVEVAMTINAGEKDTEVVANCTIQEETRTLKGTVNESTVDFEPLTISYNVEGSSASITIDLNGTLNGTALNVTGAISGNGTFVYENFPILFTLSGTTNGILNKLLLE